MELQIRPISDFAEYKMVEALQRVAWQGGDEIVVPDHALMVIQRHGGLLLGAFTPAGEAVGFVLGLVAREADGGIYHHSHMMGIHPEYRDRDVGRRLKLAQREAVLAQGINHMSWTFDPLQSRNAYLNFGKLGAICRTYIRDFYGEMADGINAGLPSDRFEVEWHLDAPRVVAHLSGPMRHTVERWPAELPVANPTADPLTPCPTPDFDCEPPYLVQIPAQLGEIKAADMTAAQAWRLQTRTLFENAFERGHIAADYRRRGEFGWYLVK